ncbi:hypothetical protein [Bradyrhizobium sp. URHD0069]|uniref:hypothetical protein n=1 Tax=Bradyrhizobium sp. URHD0069 TaxID=1380355 RepID=UPI0012DDD1E2|nr:hypothetical protein [Bradyrhizobium sp. URHD0069]
MSKKLDRLLEETAEDFGQRSAETALDLSWFDSAKCFHSEIEYAMAVALRAINCGYGWEFDGNQDVVFAWKETADSPIVQIQPKRKVGPYAIALAIRVRGPQIEYSSWQLNVTGTTSMRCLPNRPLKKSSLRKH